MPQLIQKTLANNVLVLTINSSTNRNAVSSPEMVQSLVSALEAADAAEEVRALVLTGAGPSFSSGGDLKALTASALVPAAERRLNIKKNIQRIPLAFDALEKPIIAAVNGPAVGAGCDLACMCDIRIAAQSARFAVSFVKLGIIPGDGGAWFLPRIVGHAKAAEMALTGEPIDAEEALRCGLISRVVADDALMETALGLAGRIAANPPQAVRLTKRLLRDGRHMRLDSLLDLSAALQVIAQATEDHKEALAALSERRSPLFSAR